MMFTKTSKIEVGVELLGRAFQASVHNTTQSATYSFLHKDQNLKVFPLDTDCITIPV